MTIDEKCTDIFKKILQCNTPTIRNFVERVFEENRVYDFLIECQNESLPINAVMLDWVHYDMMFLTLIICFNFKSKFKVEKAFINEEEVTSLLQKRVYNSFLLTKDLNMLKEGL